MPDNLRRPPVLHRSDPSRLDQHEGSTQPVDPDGCAGDQGQVECVAGTGVDLAGAGRPSSTTMAVKIPCASPAMRISATRLPVAVTRLVANW